MGGNFKTANIELSSSLALSGGVPPLEFSEVRDFWLSDLWEASWELGSKSWPCWKLKTKLK